VRSPGALCAGTSEAWREDAVPGVDRFLGVTEALGGELGDLDELAAAFGRRCARTLRQALLFFTLEVDERSPGAAARVQIAQPIPHIGVVGRERPQLLERAHGLVQVAELLDPQLGDAAQQHRPVGGHGRDVGASL
jgi:hypothetical protein